MLPYYSVHLYSCWDSTPPAQPLRASVPPDRPLTEQFPGRLPSHDMFEQITDTVFTMLFANCPSHSFSQPHHVCPCQSLIISLVFFSWTALQLFEGCLLAPATPLTLQMLASSHSFSSFPDAQLLSLHFPCDLRKQHPQSLQRVRCSICLAFNMPADLHLVFLFEAEQW